MTDLDDVIQNSQNEIKDFDSRKIPKIKSDRIYKKNYRLPILIVSAAVVIFQWNTLQHWIFGIPEDTIQADIITLLKNSDQKVQDIYATTGEIPTVLPADMPVWLLGYKKTLAGYKINAEVDGVLVELERTGDSVKFNHH